VTEDRTPVPEGCKAGRSSPRTTGVRTGQDGSSERRGRIFPAVSATEVWLTIAAIVAGLSALVFVIDARTSRLPGVGHALLAASVGIGWVALILGLP